jgi:hypothetical protein
MARAAILMFIGLLTGIWAGGVLTNGRALSMHFEKPPADGHVVLVAHLNALLGCFWMVSVAVTLESLRLGDGAKKLLAWGVTVVNYSNWAITLLKASLGVAGLEMVDGNSRNNVIAVLLILFVVLPGLAVSGAWVWGLLGQAEAKSA